MWTAVNGEAEHVAIVRRLHADKIRSPLFGGADVDPQIHLDYGPLRRAESGRFG